MTVLLDGNVLVALAVADHVHHELAEAWFGANARPGANARSFATTPTTNGTLLRFLLRAGLDVRTAYEVLAQVQMHPRTCSLRTTNRTTRAGCVAWWVTGR